MNGCLNSFVWGGDFGADALIQHARLGIFVGMCMICSYEALQVVDKDNKGTGF